MDLSKNKRNRFSAEEAMNYIPRTEKRNQVPVCEMPESSGSLSFPLLPILSWKPKIKLTFRCSKSSTRIALEKGVQS